MKHAITQYYTKCTVLVALVTLAFMFLSDRTSCIKYLCVEVIVGMLQGINQFYYTFYYDISSKQISTLMQISSFWDHNGNKCLHGFVSSFYLMYFVFISYVYMYNVLHVILNKSNYIPI